jgi:DHA1 family tetracycline resistance protein-like MFS transporter
MRNLKQILLPSASQEKHLSFESLFVVMLIDSFGYSLILPTLPFLVLQHNAGAEFGGILVASHALSAAISAPILGWLSDRLGRRIVIYFTLIGTLISYVIFACNASLAVLLVSRILAGAMAGNMGVVQAAAADQTTASERGRAMNLLMVAWALGFVIGPAVGAVVPAPAEQIGLWSGIVAATGSGVSFLAVLLYSSKRSHIAAAGDASLIPSTDNQPPWSRPELLFLIGVVALSQTGIVSMTGFWAESIFGWTARQVSLLFFWVSACIVAAQLFVLPRLVRHIGESATFLISVTVLSVACTAIIVNPKSASFLIFAVPVMFCGITITQTLCATFMSKLATNENRGAVMGVASSTAAIGRVVGPILCGVLFARVHPVAPFWFVSAIVTLSLVWFAGRRALARTSSVQRPGSQENDTSS